jgi:hypothetical protein
MAEPYDYFKRHQNEGWLIAHIEFLLSEAKIEMSTSSVLYAAFESRNLIEKICYDLIRMSANETEWEEIERTAKGRYGIDKANSKYKSLKLKTQTFSEQVARIVILPIKALNYSIADDYVNKLADYIHTYTRTQTEMNFASDFIQEGILLVEESLKFIKSYFTVQNGEYVYGIIKPKTLTNSFVTEFENWKSSTSTDTEALYCRLVEINKTEPLK